MCKIGGQEIQQMREVIEKSKQILFFSKKINEETTDGKNRIE